MFIFGILASWKCVLCSFVNGSYYVNDFGYTYFGIRNIYNCHLFLIVNSDCNCSNTRIQHSKSSKSMSNDETVIYVLVSWVLHNVHFRHFGELKMRFMLIRHRVLLRQWFWIYLYWDYKNLSYYLFLILTSDY